jgi:hypothetical protein
VESATLAPQPQSSPNVMAPKHKGLTRNPDFPSVLYDCNDMS